MARPLYIFDLDGTLALIDHRRPMLDNKQNPHRWRDFFAACDKDLPNTAVISTMNALLKAGAEVWIWSARLEDVRQQTEWWLVKHTAFMPEDLEDTGLLRMRPSKDNTPDEKLKASWLKQLSADDRARLVAIFDDRAKVVAMWRAAGIACFQVAPGEF